MKNIILILLLCLQYHLLIAQQHSISGRVVSSHDQKPLHGATISINDEVIAVSDKDGIFEFKVNDNAKELKITSLGFKDFLLKLQSEMDNYLVSMEVDHKALSEVIVSTGYQQIPKERSTGSFEEVSAELFGRVVTPNVLSRLDGITTGLYYSKLQGGDQINIRGLSTLTANTQPLIVLDNFPYEGDIKNINANDVESVTILKDAAAASIWGARSANGVIVITTKKGRFNQPLSVSLNSSISIQGKPQLMKDSRILRTEDHIAIEKYLFDKGFYNSKLTNKTSRPIISPVVEIFDQQKKGLISEADANEAINQLSAGDVRNEYLKYLYGQGVKQQYSISLFGGGNNISNAFSMGYDGDISNTIGNTNNRYTLRNETNFKAGKNIDIQFGVNYSLQKNSLNAIANIDPSGRVMYPYAKLADSDGNTLTVDRDYRDSYTDTAGRGLLLDWKYRPLDEVKYADNTFQSQDLLLKLGLKHKLNRTLSISLNGQAEKATSIMRNYYSTDTYYARNIINRYSQVVDAKVKYIVPFGGILDVDNRSLNAWATRAQLNYNNTWNDENKINIIAGGEIRESNNSSEYYRTYGFNENNLNFSIVDYLTQFPIYGNLSSPTVIPTGSINFTEYSNRLVSTYANAGYTFKNRYSFSASARKDASNLFGVSANNKWSPFWSAGAAWDISREEFCKVKNITYLKARFTYGYNGNINNGVAAVPTIELRAAADQITSIPWAMVKNLANRNLRWERSGILNVGIDFKAFENRIEGSIEYYNKNSIDLISPTAVDETSGISLMHLNVANLNTKGWDIRTRFIPIDKKVKWESQVLLTHVRNKVTKYYNESSNKSSYINFGNRITPRVGEDPYALTSYRYAGLDSIGNPIGYFKGAKSTRYADIVRTPTWDDLIIHGSSRPTWYGNFINSIQWNGFSLTANISYKLGYFFRRYSINYSTLFNSGLGHLDYYNRWKNPGDENHTSVPSLLYPVNSNRETLYANSEATVSKADNIRIQDISVSYRFQDKLAAKGILNQMEVYSYATNLGVIWVADKYGLDPDYGTNLPTPFILSFGLRKTF